MAGRGATGSPNGLEVLTGIFPKNRHGFWYRSWNFEIQYYPEQLFALGYAACFDSAMELTAKQLKLDAAGAKTTVEVGIGQRAEGGYGLDLDITAHLPSMAHDEAQRLVDATHQVCPYSNATRGNIEVRLHIETKGS